MLTSPAVVTVVQLTGSNVHPAASLEERESPFLPPVHTPGVHAHWLPHRIHVYTGNVYNG